ncbi:glycosyltransferase family A protein [Epilithonimonas hominis]|uniref:Glycosyltransferase family 2 protein n=1 Tax=Epilithonimonas hominis TaxID=420404 RepID=A0A3N0X7U2_9FLAO|nr:glycosyltransferase family A protein [Epilithonimonas hominis]ROI12409.1 glycosyltransferase family 2 protein [Epilithonimonas hominis]
MQKLFTVFTPTYNRAHTLPRLYNSLKNQSNKNFIWLIVDDGSNDETKTLVEGFVNEKIIEIRYIFQTNKGKHVAINNGLKNTHTDYFCVIDSDDYLAENAIQEMQYLSEKIIDNNQIAGFTFIRFSEALKYDKNKYGKKEWLSSGRIQYEWEFPGEMTFCLKTKIHQQFYFPEFEGEKFCPESLIIRRIERRYDILATDNVLSFGDYLDDGLTKNYYQLLLKNPKASLLNIKERFQDQLSDEEKLSLAKTYWDIASKSNQPFMKRFFGINPFLILRVLISKHKK